MTSRHGWELPQLELDCMIALWKGGESDVAAVRQALAARGRPLAHTTVLTVLQRLERKQMVQRRRQGRSFHFTPRIPRDEMRARALERLVRNYFDSDGQALLSYLDGRALPSGDRVQPPPPAGVELSVAPKPLDDFDATLL